VSGELRGGSQVLEETQDREEIIERVAALDIGKAELTCCVRVPHEGRPGRRLQEVQTCSTMTGSLLRLADRLRCLGVTRVVMEATLGYLLFEQNFIKFPQVRTVAYASVTVT
jgi:hypothetical protein